MTVPIDVSILHFVAQSSELTSGLGCILLIVCAAAVSEFPKRQGKVCDVYPSVSILKPLHGDEPDLFERLLASYCQDYTAPVEIICGVREDTDPAIDSVKRLLIRAENVKLVIDPRERGTNRKISNLANMLPFARHDVILMSDSDIEVEAHYLKEVISHLEEPGVGAVSCLYHGVAAPGLWSCLGALAINSHFLPNIVLALRSGLARPCFGSTIALRRSTLSRIGGFEAFADCLADDYAIGAAVQDAGYKVTISSFSVGHLCSEASLYDLLKHELRIARTIRSIRPFGYCGTILTQPLPLALIAAVAAGGRGDALLLAGLAVACRGILFRSVQHRFGLPSQHYWLLPLRDILSFIVFVTSFFGATVIWRDMRYRVTSDGHLVEPSVTP